MDRWPNSIGVRVWKSRITTSFGLFVTVAHPREASETVRRFRRVRARMGPHSYALPPARDLLALTLPRGYQPAPANAPGESWRDLRSAGQTIAECADILGVSFSTVGRTLAEHDERLPDGRPFRRAGEALWPEAFPLATLRERKRDVGTNTWSCLYQGRPVPEGGLIFSVKNFNYYDPASLEG